MKEDMTVNFSFSQYMELVREVMLKLVNSDELDEVIRVFHKTGEKVFGKKEYAQMMCAFAASSFMNLLNDMVKGLDGKDE